MGGSFKSFNCFSVGVPFNSFLPFKTATGRKSAGDFRNLPNVYHKAAPKQLVGAVATACKRTSPKTHTCRVALNAQPRNYPPRFGLQLVSLFENLLADKSGAPQAPSKIPSAEATFSSTKFCDLWEEADMVSVCCWLRGSKNIDIPATFRDLLPAHL